ncbi:FAD synthase-like [Hyposmocoma kahamanoa]|uniref:FAD synthase-like n=1 Tax=Hyposmocoma kahamanoa TaxID=1477025 RepID=UPI000E6D969B|nr:FAD synthase-like [Hyposmocoma kahamanoa]
MPCLYCEFTGTVVASDRVLRRCFERFQLKEIFLSFNGGKDCTALLDITINILQDIYKRKDIAKDLKIVYIRTKGPFKEIEEFVKLVEKHYDAKLMVSCGDMKETLQRILDLDGNLQACLMGTRRTDPYCQDLKFMQKTDPNWPQIIRVSPLLNWSYHQIWSYILQRKVPYCCLYSIGYTSIGSTQNTLPNPYLEHKHSSGTKLYHPAWFLADGSLERAGRSTLSHQTTNGHANDQNINACDLCVSTNGV